MANMSKFWKGIVFGALAGGALSLLDKHTRSAVNEGCRKTSSNISYMIKNPEEVSGKVKETANKIRASVQELTEEFNYISGKIDEVREMTPQVLEIVKETKDAFIHDNQKSEHQVENETHFNGIALDEQIKTDRIYGQRNIQ